MNTHFIRITFILQVIVIWVGFSLTTSYAENYYRPQENVHTEITVFPVQSVYLSDYDFSNLRNLPLLFIITITSDVPQTFMIEARIEHETYGLLATAEKELGNAGTFFSIDNRMFDSYVVSKASDEIVEATTGNGMLPPGEYSLMVTVFYGNDQVETTEYFVLPELSVGIDLIGPGTPLDVEPQLVYSATPYFEWFGEHKEYDFSLYEVLEDQQSPDDIATNLPVFELEKLNATNLLYPSYAELLEERKTYAWQMKSFLNTSSGVKEITSDMYWFMFSSGGKKTAGFEEIELGPDDIDILPGDSVQLKITGITSENEKVKVDCDWKVIPSNGGSVNKDNWFVAGNRETTVAIIATCEGIENYITINIRQKQ